MAKKDDGKTCWTPLKCNQTSKSLVLPTIVTTCRVSLTVFLHWRVLERVRVCVCEPCPPPIHTGSGRDRSPLGR